MFGHRYFGARYFGPRYFGGAGTAVVVVAAEGTFTSAGGYRHGSNQYRTAPQPLKTRKPKKRRDYEDGTPYPELPAFNDKPTEFDIQMGLYGGIFHTLPPWLVEQNRLEAELKARQWALIALLMAA